MTSSNIDRALFQHDCEQCIPLGQHEGCDLYFCRQGVFGATVIARYGNEGHEYTSGLAIAHMDKRLGEAQRRAIAKGLIEDAA